MDNESIYNFLNQCKDKETIRVWYHSNLDEFKLKDLLKQCLSSNNIISFETLLECGAPIYKSTIEQAISYGNINLVRKLLTLSPTLLEKIKPYSFANSQDMIYYLLSLNLNNRPYESEYSSKSTLKENERIRFEVYYQLESLKLKYQLVTEGYVETPSNQLFLEIIKYESLEDIYLNLTIIDILSLVPDSNIPYSIRKIYENSSTNENEKLIGIETLLLYNCQKMIISNPSIISINIESILLNYLKKFKKFNNIQLPQIIYYYTFSTLCLEGLHYLLLLKFKGNNCINNTGHDFVSGVLNSFNNNIYEYYLFFTLSQQNNNNNTNNNNENENQQQIINNPIDQQINNNNNNNNNNITQMFLQQHQQQQQQQNQPNINDINPTYLYNEYKKNCQLIKIDKSIFKDSNRVILFINNYYNQDIEKLIVFKQRINLVKKIFYNCSIDILEKVKDNKYFTNHFIKINKISSLKELEFVKYKWLVNIIEKDYINVLNSTINEAQFIFNVIIQDHEYIDVWEFLRRLCANDIYRNSNFFRIIASPIFSSIKGINSSILFSNLLREFEELKYPQQLINDYYNRMYRSLLSHAVKNFDISLLEFIEIKVGVVGMNNLSLLPIGARDYCVKSSGPLNKEQKSIYKSFVNHINSKSNYYSTLMGSILYSLYYPQFNFKYFNFQKYLSSTLTFIRFLAKRLDFYRINQTITHLFKGLQHVDGMPFQIELFTSDCFQQPKIFINNQFNQIKTSPIEIIKFIELYNTFCPDSYKIQLYPILYSIVLSCKDINIELVERYHQIFKINNMDIPHNSVPNIFKYIHLKNSTYFKYFLTNQNILPFIDLIEFQVDQFQMEHLTFKNIIYDIQNFEDMVFLLKDGMFKSNSNLYSNTHCNKFLIQLNREDIIIKYPEEFKINQKDALHEQFEVEVLKELLKSKSPQVIEQLSSLLQLSNENIIQLSIKMNRIDVIVHLYSNYQSSGILESYIKKPLITYIVKFNLIHSFNIINFKLLELNNITYKDILNDGNLKLFKMYLSYLKSKHNNQYNNLKLEIQQYINNSDKLKDFNLII